VTHTALHYPLLTRLGRRLETVDGAAERIRAQGQWDVENAWRFTIAEGLVQRLGIGAL
jgi:hypothetical protein